MSERFLHTGGLLRPFDPGQAARDAVLGAVALQQFPLGSADPGVFAAGLKAQIDVFATRLSQWKIEQGAATSKCISELRDALTKGNDTIAALRIERDDFRSQAERLQAENAELMALLDAATDPNGKTAIVRAAVVNAMGGGTMLPAAELHAPQRLVPQETSDDLNAVGCEDVDETEAADPSDDLDAAGCEDVDETEDDPIVGRQRNRAFLNVIKPAVRREYETTNDSATTIAGRYRMAHATIIRWAPVEKWQRPFDERKQLRPELVEAVRVQYENTNATYLAIARKFKLSTTWPIRKAAIAGGWTRPGGARGGLRRTDEPAAQPVQAGQQSAPA